MSDCKLNLLSFPAEVVVECRSGNLAVTYDVPVNSTASRGQLDTALWKQIVAEVSQTAPETQLRVVYYGQANMITGYRLYYLLSYAKRHSLTQLILQTDGGFWLEEATDWLVESGVDQITVTVDKVTGDLAAMPIFQRIAQLETVKQANDFAHPSVKIEVKDEHWAAVNQFWATRAANVTVRSRAESVTLTERVPCRYALETCTINWQGEMVACPLDAKAQFIAGQLKDTSLANLWGEAHRHLQTIHYESCFEQLPAPCATCERWVGYEQSQ